MVETAHAHTLNQPHRSPNPIFRSDLLAYLRRDASHALIANYLLDSTANFRGATLFLGM